MIKYIAGDLFGPAIEASKNAVVVVPHVVNCKGGFGSGFVVPLMKRWPHVREAYLAWFNNQLALAAGSQLVALHCLNNPPFALGETLFISVADQSQIVVAHMCAQTLGGNRPLFYNALARCMEQVAKYADQRQAVIHAPAFGSGLAGGDWDFIEKLIEDCWIRDKEVQRMALDTTIYYLPGTLPTVEKRVNLKDVAEQMILNRPKPGGPNFEGPLPGPKTPDMHKQYPGFEGPLPGPKPK